MNYRLFQDRLKGTSISGYTIRQAAIFSINHCEHNNAETIHVQRKDAFEMLMDRQWQINQPSKLHKDAEKMNCKHEKYTSLL